MNIKQTPRVVFDENAPEPVLFAAEELKRYTGLILGDSPGSQPPPGQPEIHLVQSGGDEAGTEEIAFYEQDGNLYIRSARPGNILFGAYEFLRQYGGCRFAGPGEECEYVPRKESIVVEDLPRSIRTTVWRRSLQLHWRVDEKLVLERIDWMGKHGFNFLAFNVYDDTLPQGDYGKVFDPATGEQRTTEWHSRFGASVFRAVFLPELRKRGIALTTAVHNLLNFLPPDKYFKSHPEWYALVDGKRSAAPRQLCVCTSNEDMVKEFISNVLEYMEKYPDIKQLSIGPMDGNGGCECGNCRKMDYSQDEHLKPVPGVRRGFRCSDMEQPSKIKRYALFVNQIARSVAERFPDMLIGIQAYGGLNFPPRDVELEPNVVVRSSMYWRCGAHSIEPEACDANRFFHNVILGWIRKTSAGRTIIGDNSYMGMKSQKSLPYPIEETLYAEWQAFKRMGIGGNGAQCHDGSFLVYVLNYAAFARSCWHDEPDASALLDEYLIGMFGAAGEALRPVYESFHSTVKKIVGRGKEFSIFAGHVHPRAPKDNQACLEPTGSNIVCFIDELGEARLDECMAAARAAASNEREKKQIETFALAVEYWKKAAAFFRVYWPLYVENPHRAPLNNPELQAKMLEALDDITGFLKECPIYGKGWINDVTLGNYEKLAREIRRGLNPPPYA